MSFLKSLFSKLFLLQLLIAAVISVGGIYAFLKFLDAYTRHNESIEVPDFKGFHYSELNGFIADKNLNFVIIDSIFDPNSARGIVIDQHPVENQLVKSGRKIYLTINSVSPPKVVLPELKDMTLRSAISRLQTYGLKVGEIIPRASECDNCVVGLSMNGKMMESGIEINKGSTIDIISGAGESSMTIILPPFFGMTLSEARAAIQGKGLNVGIVAYDPEVGSDSSKSFVYKQFPTYTAEQEINLGKSIDLFFTLDSNKLPEFELIPQDSLSSLTP